MAENSDWYTQKHFSLGGVEHYFRKPPYDVRELQSVVALNARLSAWTNSAPGGLFIPQKKEKKKIIMVTAKDCLTNNNLYFSSFDEIFFYCKECTGSFLNQLITIYDFHRLIIDSNHYLQWRMLSELH